MSDLSAAVFDLAGVRPAIAAAHEFFEANSGWGEPSIDALQEWLADRACQCPDECWVAPIGVCEHGLASWFLILRSLGDHEELDAAVGPDLHLRHAPNFRDLGGIVAADGRRIRSGRLFRSGVFDALDDVDRSLLGAIGLETAIDLRSDDERAARVNVLSPATRQVHFPVVDVSAHPATIAERIERGDTDGLGAEMLIAGNRSFASTHAPAFGRVARLLLAASTQPAVVHCTAGKDRTGFAVACVLWTLGVDHETVVVDYLRTNRIMHERHSLTLAAAAERGIDTTKLEEMLVVRRSYLDAARDAAIETFGSIDAFVQEGLGVDAAMRDEARDRLLVTG